MKKTSICISCMNRSKVESPHGILHLFPNCIESIAEVCDGDDVEIIVADWNSTDWPLEDWIFKKSGDVPVKVVKINDEYFNRGKGLNVAASNAKYDRLLFLDTDILVSKRLFESGHKVLDKNKVFFPMCYAHHDYEKTTGKWVRGYGLCMINKEAFEIVGKWPAWSSWGGEDNLFHKNVKKRYKIHREKVEGLLHMWHPKYLGNYEKKPRYHWEKYHK